MFDPAIPAFCRGVITTPFREKRDGISYCSRRCGAFGVEVVRNKFIVAGMGGHVDPVIDSAEDYIQWAVRPGVQRNKCWRCGFENELFYPTRCAVLRKYRGKKAPIEHLCFPNNPGGHPSPGWCSKCLSNVGKAQKRASRVEEGFENIFWDYPEGWAPKLANSEKCAFRNGRCYKEWRWNPPKYLFTCRGVKELENTLVCAGCLLVAHKEIVIPAMERVIREVLRGILGVDAVIELVLHYTKHLTIGSIPIEEV